MKPHKISFVNAVTLISFGLWGYFDGDAEKNITALIPVFFGIIILVLYYGLILLIYGGGGECGENVCSFCGALCCVWNA